MIRPSIRTITLIRPVVMLLVLLLSSGINVASQDAPTTISVRIEAPTAAERTALVEMGIDVVSADFNGLTARVTPAQLSAIQGAGFTYHPLPDAQVAGAVDEAYHDYDETVAELERIAQRYPQIASMSVVGSSVEARPLYALKISDHAALDEDEPEVLFFARTHAREHLTTEMALYIADFLTAEYGVDGSVTNLVNQREIWVLPDVNPDGGVYDVESGFYRFWRKNRQPNPDGSFGIDLNRNYAYQWGCCGGSSGYPGDDTYRGPSPFSEPETAAMRDFALAHPDLTASISFHSYAELVLWPFGHTYEALPPGMDPTDRDAFVAIGRQMAGLNGYIPSQASGLYIVDGGSDDWLYGERGIFAFTFEMYPRSDSPGFYPPGSVIERETQRNRAAIEYFLGVADNPRKVVGDGGDLTPPTATLTWPPAGSTIFGEVTLEAQATDDVAVTLVEFLANGQTVGLVSAPPYTMRWDGASVPGVVQLQARAYDAGHNVGASAAVQAYRSAYPPLRYPLVKQGYSW